MSGKGAFWFSLTMIALTGVTLSLFLKSSIDFLIILKNNSTKVMQEMPVKTPTDPPISEKIEIEL